MTVVDSPQAPPAPAAPVAPATAFTRVCLVAPRVRIDVALPSDVAVAELLAVLLDMAGENSPDGGAQHGGWCLTRIGQAPLPESGTLANARVVDGELLHLHKRSELPPAPLFDDVIDAVATSTPATYLPWTTDTARTMGAVAATGALLTATTALYLAGPGYAAAVVAGVVALLGVGSAAVLDRVYSEPSTATLLAACMIPMAFLAGLYAVPGGPGRPNLLLGAVLVVVFAVGSVSVLGSGLSIFIAAAAAGGLGAVAALIAVLIAHPVAGIGAGLAAASLVGLSTAPRLTIHLAKLPLPRTPITPGELAEDDQADLPDLRGIEQRSAQAHAALTGILVGCSLTAVLGALLAAPAGLMGIALAATVAAVLMLRSRTYANGLQAVALLAAGMLTAGGVVVGRLVTADGPATLWWSFGGLLLLAVCALVLGVTFPQRQFSPPLRRTVEIVEALAIVAIAPLALGVMDLYATMRGL